MAEPKTAVVILAGGEGRRMGGGKPLQKLGNITLVDRALDLARAWSDTVAVAVRSADQVGDLTQVPLLLDDETPGPVAGLASALRFAAESGADRVLTIPCDAPHLPADLLSRLAQVIGDGSVAVASSGGQIHPVCALWRTDVRDRLPAYLATGRSSLWGFAGACGMAVAAWDGGPDDPFANANTPEDLARLQPPSPRSAP